MRDVCWFGVNATAQVERYAVAGAATLGLSHWCSLERKPPRLAGQQQSPAAVERRRRKQQRLLL